MGVPRRVAHVGYILTPKPRGVTPQDNVPLSPHLEAEVPLVALGIHSLAFTSTPWE